MLIFALQVDKLELTLKGIRQGGACDRLKGLREESELNRDTGRQLQMSRG